MSPEEIKAALARPAVEFSSGGPQTTYVTTKSWLGRVYLGRPGETLLSTRKASPCGRCCNWCWRGCLRCRKH